MNRTLGPRNLGDILSQTFAIYKNNFLRFTAIVAIVQVPMAIVYNIVGLLPQSVLEEPGALSSITPMDFLIGIPLALASLVACTIMQGAVIHAISEQYFNQPVNIGRAYSIAWRRMADMFWALVLVSLAIVGITIATIGISSLIYFSIHLILGNLAGLAVSVILALIGILAAIYLGITWAFILQAALLEGCSPTVAISHSSALVKKNWWRVLGILLLLAVIVATIIIIFNILATIITAWTTFGPPTWTMIVTIMVAMIVAAIGSIVSLPIAIIGEALLYFDLRVRKQGYDLHALANELELKHTFTDDVASPPE